MFNPFNLPYEKQIPQPVINNSPTGLAISGCAWVCAWFCFCFEDIVEGKLLCWGLGIVKLLKLEANCIKQIGYYYIADMCDYNLLVIDGVV